MATKASKDRFAYFSGGLDEDDIDSNEEEDVSDEEVGTLKTKIPSFITKPTEKTASLALPSAKEALKTVASPEFLEHRSKDVDWDKLTKNETEPKEEEIPVDKSNTNAMPPPKSYTPLTEALKPTLGDKSDKSVAEKRAYTCTDPDTEGSPSSKTLKTS